MASVASTFKTHEPNLPELLEELHKGTDPAPRLPAGVGLGRRPHPGADRQRVALLPDWRSDAPGDWRRRRPVQAAPLRGSAASRDRAGQQRLILDGQQRLTSLYMALRSGKPVQTRTEKRKDIERVYYLDIARCLDPEADRLDAVLSLPTRPAAQERLRPQDRPRRQHRREGSTRPASSRSTSSSTRAVLVLEAGLPQVPLRPDERCDLCSDSSEQILQRFHQYRVPMIVLLPTRPRRRSARSSRTSTPAASP